MRNAIAGKEAASALKFGVRQCSDPDILPILDCYAIRERLFGSAAEVALGLASVGHVIVTG